MDRCLSLDMDEKTGSAWDAAAAAGIDITLLLESLRRTPWERIRENSRALKLIGTLREAMLWNPEKEKNLPPP